MDAVQPAWKIISLIFGLGMFLGVGAISLGSGDDLLWGVGKAFGSFVICWIVLNQLGVLLNVISTKQSTDLMPDQEIGGEMADNGNERG